MHISNRRTMLSAAVCAAFACGLTACGPVVIPGPPTARAIAIRCVPPGATVRLGAPQITNQDQVRDNNGTVTFRSVTNDLPSGLILEGDAPGYPHYAVVVESVRTGAQQFSVGTCVAITVPSFQTQLALWQPLFPRPPTRADAIGIRLTFQGLECDIPGIGLTKWFEPWLNALTPPQRQSIYACKHAAHDTHLNLFFATTNGGFYAEFAQFPQRIGEANPLEFRALVEEVIKAGFIPLIAYDGDCADDPICGHPNALRQVPILYNLLKSSPYGDLNPYVTKARMYDGVFYGSSPENIVLFGDAFRAIDPNGYLVIQHNSGHIPVGEGGADYLPGGRMRAYDGVLGEFDDAGLPYQGNDTMWQIIGRMVFPYHRPTDQIGDSDPPPFYLVDSARGPRTYICFESNTSFGAYAWVRNWVTAAIVQLHRQYLIDLGCRYTG